MSEATFANFSVNDLCTVACEVAPLLTLALAGNAILLEIALLD